MFCYLRIIEKSILKKYIQDNYIKKFNLFINPIFKYFTYIDMNLDYLKKNNLSKKINRKPEIDLAYQNEKKKL